MTQLVQLHYGKYHRAENDTFGVSGVPLGGHYCTALSPPFIA